MNAKIPEGHETSSVVMVVRNGILVKYSKIIIEEINEIRKIGICLW
jgi:hypothetical protein